jgi:hypothetical protein
LCVDRWVELLRLEPLTHLVLEGVIRIRLNEPAGAERIARAAVVHTLQVVEEEQFLALYRRCRRAGL